MMSSYIHIFLEKVKVVMRLLNRSSFETSFKRFT